MRIGRLQEAAAISEHSVRAIAHWFGSILQRPPHPTPPQRSPIRLQAA